MILLPEDFLSCELPKRARRELEIVVSQALGTLEVTWDVCLLRSYDIVKPNCLDPTSNLIIPVKALGKGMGSAHRFARKN
jgi:hypothetical protein